MAKVKSLWECASCGYQQTKWAGNCYQCKEWNTFVEKSKMEQLSRGTVKHEQPLCLKEVEQKNIPRIMSGLKEFDRLVGEGIVPGALMLIAGLPGIGKSTLLMQLANYYGKSEKKILYVCGEESVEQTSLRAKRLKVSSSSIFLYHETDMQQIKKHIEEMKPDILMVDSVQILFKPEISSAPGSITQVREVTNELMHLSKGFQISTFIVGHVTKSGEIAGPRVLEHLVDLVIEFEGDRHHGYRILRSVKNRFGSTDDLALFHMEEEGLKEVQNPSQVFLEDRAGKTHGSVITSAMEGARSFLIEVQALVTFSSYQNPSRKSTGIDANRLALLLAVLEKRLGYRMHSSDVFVSIAGGIKIIEPAIDLAITLSIASSFTKQFIDPHTIILGEVGLSGEVRPVSRVETRLKEAEKMGFKRCFLPLKNQKSFKGKTSIELLGVRSIEEAIQKLF